MQYSEFGKEHSIAVILVHPFPFNRHFWNAQAEELGKVAHVVAPGLLEYQWKDLQLAISLCGE
jgi:hypothetical protein